MESNAKEFSPERGAFATIALRRGVTRQAIKYLYDKGDPDTVTEVVEYSIKVLNEKKASLLRLAKQITEQV